MSVSGPGLRRISSGIASLPRSCRLAASRVSSTCSAIDAEAGRDPRRQLGDAVGMAAGVGVAGVDRPGEAGRGAEARCAVRPGRQPPQLGDLDDVRPVDAHLVLAVLLRPVERAVRAADELVAAELVLPATVAMPALTVTGPMCSSSTAAMRLDDRLAPRRARPPRPGRAAGSRTRRRRGGTPRRPGAGRVASCASTLSPAGWPKRSLIRLKSSMSTRQRLSG